MQNGEKEKLGNNKNIKKQIHKKVHSTCNENKDKQQSCRKLTSLRNNCEMKSTANCFALTAKKIRETLSCHRFAKHKPNSNYQKKAYLTHSRWSLPSVGRSTEKKSSDKRWRSRGLTAF